MRIGTKSVLFGAHCFFLHPWFVARAWWKLYGFPWDPRLWIAFIVHDLGYVGKPNMDGEEGERHVEFGAQLMSWLFGVAWGDLCGYHSRFYARQCGAIPSRLCYADKLAIALTPHWLYLPMARATGELREYMGNAKRDTSRHWVREKYKHMRLDYRGQREWYQSVQQWCLRYVGEHKDGAEDTWTPMRRS